MKKFAVIVLAMAALFLLTPVAALAQASQVFNSSVMQSDTQTEPVFQRYFSTFAPVVNDKCSDVCGIKPCDVFNGQDYCQIQFGGKGTQGYKGYDQDIANFGVASGTVFQSVIEIEKNPSAGNHVGYYAWAIGPVVFAETSQWNAAKFDCAGTSNASSCIGNANSSNAVPRTGVPNSSGATNHTLSPIGGFSPLPVPRAFDIDGDGNAGTNAGARGFYQLQWDAVQSIGDQAGVAAAGYEIYAARTTGSSSAPGSCAAPNPGQFGATAAKVVTTTQAQVTDAEIGGPLGANECVTFALRVRFGSTSNGTVVASRYLSANGQSFFGSGGLSANVYELGAKFTAKNSVSVSWKTALEDGVRGFYISRATTQNGEYSRVSDLIPAKGEASAYSFIDTIQVPTGAVKAKGLWYKVETIDIDDNAVEYGPTKAQLPGPAGSSVIKQRTAKPQR